MTTLVFLEHHDGAIQKGALGVLARALALGGDVAGRRRRPRRRRRGRRRRCLRRRRRLRRRRSGLRGALAPAAGRCARGRRCGFRGREHPLRGLGPVGGRRSGTVGATRRRSQLGPHRLQDRRRSARRHAPCARRHGSRRGGLDEHAADSARALGRLRARRDGRQRNRARRSPSPCRTSPPLRRWSSRPTRRQAALRSRMPR